MCSGARTSFSNSGTIERGIYYVESPRDGRALFVMHAGSTPQLMIGTTGTRFRGESGTT